MAAEKDLFKKSGIYELTDIEVAMHMIRLLDSLSNDRGRENVPETYIVMARTIMDTMKNPAAIELLRKRIEDYS